jgi:hypothetical protein
MRSHGRRRRVAGNSRLLGTTLSTPPTRSARSSGSPPSDAPHAPLPSIPETPCDHMWSKLAWGLPYRTLQIARRQSHKVDERAPHIIARYAQTRGRLVGCISMYTRFSFSCSQLCYATACTDVSMRREPRSQQTRSKYTRSTAPHLQLATHSHPHPTLSSTTDDARLAPHGLGVLYPDFAMGQDRADCESPLPSARVVRPTAVCCQGGV